MTIAMSTRRRLLGFGAVLLLVGLLLPAARALAATPSVALASATPAVGDWLEVELSGFSPGPVQVELCSADHATTTSTACDLSGAGQVAMSEAGTGSGLILVAQPPEPCPCVVLARALQTGESAEAPIEFGTGQEADTESAPVPGQSEEAVAPGNGQVVLATRFDQPQDVRSVLSRFFGWETTLTVQVGALNRGDRSVRGGTTEIWASSSERPTPRLVGQLDLAALPAGDRGTVQATIVLPGPVLNPTTIWLRPYGAGPDQIASTVVTDRSWGLIAVAAVVVAECMVLAGRIGYGLVSAIVNRKQLRRGPRRTGWRPSLVGAAIALLVVAVAGLAQAVSSDRAAEAHWERQTANGLIDADVRTSTPIIALPSTLAGAAGEAHWRVLSGVGPAVLTAGVGLFPGSDDSPLLLGVGDQPGAPFARLAELQRGEVVVITDSSGTSRTYRVSAVDQVATGTPVTPGRPGELTLWAIASAPGRSTDTVIRAVDVQR